MRVHKSFKFDSNPKWAWEFKTLLLDRLSEKEKIMILRDKICRDLQGNNHYGQIATMLIDMGHEKLVDEVGLKPSNFTGSPELKNFTEIDLNTGEYEPPILFSEINNKKGEE